MVYIEVKKLNLETQNNISRMLVTLLIAKFRPTPTRGDRELAGKLILLYPFMKDDDIEKCKHMYLCGYRYACAC